VKHARLLGAYVVLAAVGSVLLLSVRAEPLVQALSRDRPEDGLVDYLGANCFLDGISPYDFSAQEFRDMHLPGFGHPPTMPLWFVPFAGVSLEHLAGAIGLVMIAILFAHCALLTRELGAPAPLATAFLLFAGTLSSWWMVYHLQVGQSSVAIAFAYLVAWICLRRGRDTAGGAALGLACTMKLFPGLLVAYLATRRRWRAVGAAALAFLVPAALATARFGVSAWPKFFEQQKPIASFWMGSPINESLQGVILRLYKDWLPTSGTDDRATLVSTAIAALLLGAFWLLDRRARRRDGDVASFDVSFALLMVLSVFLNPWVWGHYGVFLLLPLAIAVRALASDGRPAWALAVAGVVALRSVNVFSVLFGWMMTKDHPPDPRIGTYALILWLPWALTILLLGALLWARRHPAAAC
jgi:hypothetical protein